MGKKVEQAYEHGQDSVRIEGVYLSKTLAVRHEQKIEEENWDDRMGEWIKDESKVGSAIITKSIRGINSYSLSDRKTLLVKKLVD